VSKPRSIKEEIEKIFENSDCVNLTSREKDPKHSKLVLEWVLELKPDANEALRIAALGHDIDRAIEKRRVKKENFKDYRKYKKEHAKESAKIIGEMLKKHDLERNFINKVKFLIESHETGGSEEADILKKADSLTFFSFDIYYYLKSRGVKKTKDKISYMYKRLPVKARRLVSQVKFKDKTVESLFREVAANYLDKKS